MKLKFLFLFVYNIYVFLQANGNSYEKGFDPKYHSLSEILFKTKTSKDKWDPIS